jgi:hypothetical protein
MESNGESNKIQVSETTAELIKKAGKGYVFKKNGHCCYRFSGSMNDFFGVLEFPWRIITHMTTFCYRHWLTLREEKIMAKGKGWMQTYWCDPRIVTTAHSSNGESDGMTPSHLGSETGGGDCFMEFET